MQGFFQNIQKQINVIIDKAIEANLPKVDQFQRIEYASQIKSMIIITFILFLGGVSYFMKHESIFGLKPFVYFGACIAILTLIKYGKKNISDIIFTTLIVTFNLIAAGGDTILSASAFVFLFQPIIQLVRGGGNQLILSIISVILCLFHVTNTINVFQETDKIQFFQILDNYRTCSCIFIIYTQGIIYLINKRNVSLKTQLKEALDDKKQSLIKLEETIRSRDIFFASVSHDLRNPLHSVIGGLEYLEKDRESQDALNIIFNAKVCGEVLLNLINNLLDTSKLDAGKMELNIENIESFVFFSKLWSISQQLIKKNNLQLSLQVSKQFPLSMKLDYGRLMQILFNLVSNASKFTEKGSINIIFTWIPEEKFNENYYLTTEQLVINSKSEKKVDTQLVQVKEDQIDQVLEELSEEKSRSSFLQMIENYKFDVWNNKRTQLLSNKDTNTDFRSVSDNHIVLFTTKGHTASVQNTFIQENQKFSDKDTKGFLKIEVIDTGCGISQDGIQQLFKPFSQAHTKISSKYGGTGLGLYISRCLSKLMNGDMRVYSQQNHGTQFIAIVQVLSLVNYQTQQEINKLDDHSQFKQSEQEQQSNFKILYAGQHKNIFDNLEHHMKNYEIHQEHNEDKILSLLKLNKLKVYSLVIDFDTKGFMSILNTFLFLNQQNDIKHQMIVLYEKNQQNQIDHIITSYTDIFKKNNQIFMITPQNTKDQYELYNKITKFQQKFLTNIKINENCLHSNLDSVNTQLHYEGNSQVILVVDDEQFNINICLVFLKKENYIVKQATNGQEAIDILSELKYQVDLILMDCNMPIMNGLDASKIIKKKCQEQNILSIPIIGISGNHETKYQIECIQSGMDKTLVKPIKFTELIKEVKLLLDKSKKQQSFYDFKLGFAKLT